MTKSILRRDFLISYLFIFFFAYDFIAKLLITYANIIYPYNYAVVVKTILILLAFLNLSKRTINKQWLWYTLFLGVAYIVGQITILQYLTKADILFNGYYFLSSSLFFIFNAFLFDYKNNALLERILQLLVYFLAFNALFIFAGALLEVELFETYFRGKRFGYQGLLLYHSEAGYIYFIGLFLANEFYKKRRAWLQGSLLLVLFLATFLIGTKKALFLSLIFFGYFLYDNRQQLNNKYVYLSGLGIVIVSILFRNVLFEKYISKFTIFYDIYKKEGFITSFLSYRDVLFEKNFLSSINEMWSWVNYLTGGPAFATKRIEMEVFDLYLFFGIIGLIIYILAFRKLLKESDRKVYFLIISLLIATTLSGNLFSSVNVMLLLSIVVCYLKNNKTTIIDN